MIIIINGPLGIGKSETAWALLSGFKRAVMLDGDYIAALHPFDYYQQDDLDYAHNLFQLLIQYHLDHGYTTFIINWVFESADQLQRLRMKLGGFGLPIMMYRLTCDPAVLEQRIRHRGRAAQAWEVQRGRELTAILAAAARDGSLGTVIDTTDLRVEDVVEHIRRDLQTAIADHGR